MKAHVQIECPYCGLKKVAVVKFGNFITATVPQMVVCDPDEGGCDNYFVFEVRAALTVTTGTVGGDMQPTLRNVPLAEPEEPEPNWDNAPEWAQWWTVDKDGWAQWFAEKPFLDERYSLWSASLAVRDPQWRAGCHVTLNGINWRDTLRQRPQAVWP